MEIVGHINNREFLIQGSKGCLVVNVRKKTRTEYKPLETWMRFKPYWEDYTGTVQAKDILDLAERTIEG